MGYKEEEMGSLAKVYIIHGWTYSTDKWEPFLNRLNEKGVGFEMLKIPGLTAPIGEVWSIDDYVRWLNKKLPGNRGKLTLLGHSNGGRIAAAFISKYPGRVDRLLLIDSAGILNKKLTFRIKKIFFSILAKTTKKIVSSDLLKNLTYKLLGEEDYNKADPILKKTMINLISKDCSLEFGKINIPTLIIWGKEDKITPLSDGKKIHSLIKNSEFEVVEAGHSPQFSDPGKIADVIVRFINSKH
jgi:pimeloyl-ACP methyl ester carboxylesterase